MNMTVFWNFAPCSKEETDRHFTDDYRLHHQGNEKAWRENMG
jgi:hypothetical protein